MPNITELFEQLIAEALNQGFSGWDFSFLTNRMVSQPVSWDYRQRVLDRLKTATALLDMGTGGGEFLASLTPLPQTTYATEAYQPNVPIARKRLEPLGVQVIEVGSDDRLPFDDGQFDLVINRHESYSTTEVFRILRPGGVFLTQQVGGTNNQRLNELLQDSMTLSDPHWNLAYALQWLHQSGFQILEQYEEFPEARFTDIGAVVYYLKAIPWQIPDFTIEQYRDRLFAIHQHIQQTGALHVKEHRFYFEVRKPSIIVWRVEGGRP